MLFKNKAKLNTELIASDSAMLPPIDLTVPEHLQTATFALG
jgi:hypothetical protein